MYSKINVLGRPIHPMLAAYPIALYTSTLVAYIVHAANKDPFFFKPAVAATLAGVVMAAITALVLFVINAIIHTGNWNNPSGEGSGIILALLGVLCTVGAGYFGWTMIQTDHVGVALTPEQECLECGMCTV